MLFIHDLIHNQVPSKYIGLRDSNLLLELRLQPTALIQRNSLAGTCLEHSKGEPVDYTN
jgi:hypothetical protein